MFATPVMLQGFAEYLATMQANIARALDGPPYLLLMNLHAVERDCTGALEFIALIRREQAETAAALAVPERRAA